MNKKMVVCTGSFNPISKAHYEIMNYVVNELNADKGLFVITNNAYLISKMVVKHPSKASPFILSEDIRREMVESLNVDNPKLFYGGIELGNESPSTIRTLKKVMRENKGYDLYFLVGADKVSGLGNWQDMDQLINLIHFVVVERNDIDVRKFISSHPLLSQHMDRFEIVKTPLDLNEISSTEIRNRFFAGLDYKDLMSDGPYKILSRFTKDDFKPLSDEEIIKDSLLFGGRFSGNLARKLVFSSNTKLFNEKDGKYNLKDSIVGSSKVYDKEFNVNDINKNFETTFDCVNEDCVDTAERLIEQGFNPAILNLASRTSPCGQYNEGSNAQEESLCYSSNLSQSLYQFGNLKYKHVRNANVPNIPGVYPMEFNFGGIYSPEVTFFRNNEEKYYSLREKPFKCPVISVASLAYSERHPDELKYFDSEGKLILEGREIETNRIRTIYRIALDNNHDSLVLGAFGCGVYHLNCREVAELFRDVLNETEFKNKFKHITFAIYEGKGSSRKVVGKDGKFKAFYDIYS